MNVNFRTVHLPKPMASGDSPVRPLFLFSLPRSGSTLAQRVLAAHSEIATVSEPWILLPFLYTLRDRGIYTEYRHHTAVRAMKDFCCELPDGVSDYLAEMRAFVLRLYAKAANGPAKYFLDKTPRYHLVVDDVIRLFPGGKFIFLWRNPLAVIASMIDSFKNGRWELYRLQVDLFDGLLNLIAAYTKYKRQVCDVRYEDILANPGVEWQRVFSYLDLPFDSRVLSDFGQIQLKGRYGDSTGVKRYQGISTEPLEKWKHNLSNPIRKLWCRRYLLWIGRERLRVMGYDLDSLLVDLSALPPSFDHLASDVVQMVFGVGYCFFEPHIMKHKLSNLPAWYRMHSHA